MVWHNAKEQYAAAQSAETKAAFFDELCGYIADMCIYLGDDPAEVPCDAWRLRDLIVQQKQELENARRVVRALETLHRQLQVRFSFMHGGVHWKENTLDPTSIVLLATKISEGRLTKGEWPAWPDAVDILGKKP